MKDKIILSSDLENYASKTYADGVKEDLNKTIGTVSSEISAARTVNDKPDHHQLPEFTQTHIHRVGDAIQPSHPLLSPFPSAPQSLPASESFPMSQHFT